MFQFQNYHRQYINDTSSLSKNDAATNGTYRTPFSAQSGNVAGSDYNSAYAASVNPPGRDALSRSDSDEDDTRDTMADDLLDNDDERQGRKQGDAHKRGKGEDSSDEESKWIHRDKLAKIESEELQAAGIILPGSRSRSRPRRDRSQSTTRHGADGSRKRKDSSIALDSKTPDTNGAINGWANEADDDLPTRPTTGSRIPVPKKSPGLTRTRENSPEELDKKVDVSKARSRSNSTTLRSLDPPTNLKNQPIKRAGTDASPKKSTPSSGARKASAPAKTIPPEARGKPKPKNKSTTNGSGSGSGTRPSTRDGLRDSSTGSLGSKQMEGDPPWMINAYKPDPRLPPDQQLLPTVARRLAQERWEQEGKFGNIYDKDFRPLTDEGYLQPPTGASSSGDNIVNQTIEAKSDEWPLKSPEPKSPASVGRSSTYSTMPKIQDKLPSHQSPLPSPRPPQNAIAPPPQPLEITRVPDVEKVEDVKGKQPKKKEGCGCCIVM